MKAVEIIQLSLQYIDNHIAENLSYDSLAKEFHYSSFYFHRVFVSITGITITDYIRNRRLEIASKMLCETKISSTDICFGCGFNSVPTFYRLFKSKYNVTPVQYRKLGIIFDISNTDLIIENYLKQPKGDVVMIPKLVSREAFFIVGVEKYTGNGFQVIGEAWGILKQRCEEIKNRVNTEVSYGYEDYSKDFKTDPMQFYYMAGVEVSSLDDIPEGMMGKSIPATNFAVFTVKGNNSNGEIGKAFRYIYDEWLPNSEYTYSSDICGDFEFYDERWNCESEDSEIDIYLPISTK